MKQPFTLVSRFSLIIETCFKLTIEHLPRQILLQNSLGHTYWRTADFALTCEWSDAITLRADE